MTGLFILRRRGQRPRLICSSHATKAFVWPYAFTQFTPAARLTSQWAARNGAIVHPSLRLVPSHNAGYKVISLRSLERGTCVASLPLRIALQSSLEDRSTVMSGTLNPEQQLCHLLIRGLVDDTCPWKKYLEYLHDVHNYEMDEETNIVDSVKGLTNEVDRILGGNAITVRGVLNAPFLDKEILQTAKHRVQWVRLQQLRRELEQSVPHFSSQAASWAISMMLSRSIVLNDGERMLLPILDLFNHSFRPTAHFVIHDSGVKKKRKSVMSAPYVGNQKQQCSSLLASDDKEPYCHVLLVRDIHCGDEVTLRYSDRGIESVDDQEFWQMQYGFVPSSGNKKKWRSLSDLTNDVQSMIEGS